MIAGASQIIYPRCHAFFVPAEGFLQGWHLSDSQNQKTCCFYTAKHLHREVFTRRSFYAERDLHRAAFTQTLLHTDAFTYRSFYTEKPFLKKPYHMKPLHRAALHTDPFHKDAFYTGTLTRRCPSFCAHALQKEAFRHRNFYSLFTRKLLHRSFCTEMPLQTETFTHRSFYSEKPLNRAVLRKQKLLHREDLHREAFSQTSVCGEEL